MAGCWLHWGDSLAMAHTKHAAFEGLRPAEDAMTLEGLRELGVRRNQGLCGDVFKLASATMQDQVLW